MKRINITIWFLCCLCFSGTAQATIFSTWEGFEADKLASIWLIQRFISPDAEIQLYPVGKKPEQGIQFDTPYSEISRQFNRSTFVSLLEHYQIADPILNNIAKLIHDIEINLWEKKLYKKTTEMHIFFMDLLSQPLENDVIIQKAVQYFDRLYEDLPSKPLTPIQ
jgi:hypothetical protein